MVRPLKTFDIVWTKGKGKEKEPNGQESELDRKEVLSEGNAREQLRH
jgi:hypothetical protein